MCLGMDLRTFRFCFVWFASWNENSSLGSLGLYLCCLFVQLVTWCHSFNAAALGPCRTALRMTRFSAGLFDLLLTLQPAVASPHWVIFPPYSGAVITLHITRPSSCRAQRPIPQPSWWSIVELSEQTLP
jgi:hypothetical protein